MIPATPGSKHCPRGREGHAGWSRAWSSREQFLRAPPVNRGFTISALVPFATMYAFESNATRGNMQEACI